MFPSPSPLLAQPMMFALDQVAFTIRLWMARHEFVLVYHFVINFPRPSLPTTSPAYPLARTDISQSLRFRCLGVSFHLIFVIDSRPVPECVPIPRRSCSRSSPLICRVLNLHPRLWTLISTPSRWIFRLNTTLPSCCLRYIHHRRSWYRCDISVLNLSISRGQSRSS